MNNDWSLEGKRVNVGEVGKYPLGVYPPKIIETLRKKLIEDIESIFACHLLKNKDMMDGLDIARISLIRCALEDTLNRINFCFGVDVRFGGQDYWKDFDKRFGVKE